MFCLQLHDGAIFVRCGEIIAVKAFFRLSGEYKQNAMIGHGTRHASAIEFSKHSKTRKSVTLVLSEEDGLIRSCIAGTITKIHCSDIAKLIACHHYYQYSNTYTNTKEELTVITEGNCDADLTEIQLEDGDEQSGNRRASQTELHVHHHHHLHHHHH